MNLEKLVENLEWKLIAGSAKIPITGIALNSNDVRSGYLFVALKGEQTNGHLYISDALKRGAAAVAVTNFDTIVAEKCNLIGFDGSLENLSSLAQSFYGQPDCKLIGITGTNGKTTTSYLVKYFLEKKGYRVGLIGTVAYEFEERIIPSDRTTPDLFKLYRLLKQMVMSGAQVVVMEVSSHALQQKRIGNLNFDIAAFTNLTQDHLDYHNSMENYFLVKKSIFEHLKIKSESGVKFQAIVSVDDEWGKMLVEALLKKNIDVSSYAINFDADVQAQNVQVNTDGSTFELFENGVECGIKNINLIGRHNVANYLGAISIANQFDSIIDVDIKKIMELPAVSGRLEFIPNNLGFVIVVDYAHTDDALKKTLCCLRELTENKLWVVFGCGGNRDISKRQRMGEVAEKFADNVILTNDNPRTEDANKIIADIQNGMKMNSEKVCVKRSDAVFFAISNAKPGDVVLLAGKGHEAYQEVNRVFYDYDDRIEARKVIAELEKNI